MISLGRRASGMRGATTRGPRWTQIVPPLMAVVTLGGLVLAIDPRALVRAAAHFDMRVLIAVLPLCVAYYALQGLRWHLLLRVVGSRLRLAESQLLNLAGQVVTAMLPLGDLTRALFVSRMGGIDVGAAAATVTVQELTFVVLLVLVAAPGLVVLPGGLLTAVVVVCGIGGVVAILTAGRVYAAVRALVVRTPGLRRLSGQIDTLQGQAASLLTRPDVLAGAWLDLLRVVVLVSAFWLILLGLGGGPSSWWDAAVVVAVSYVGGALSVLPGGIGANEASVVAVLVALGASPGEAGIAALLQRIVLSAPPTIGGLIAYVSVAPRLSASPVTDVRVAAPCASEAPC